MSGTCFRSKMRFFRGQPKRWILAVFMVFLAACQSGGLVPATAVSPASTQTLTSTPAVTPTPLVTSTPAITLTPTLPKELQVKSADLKGKEIRFWHPLAGDPAGQMDRLVTQFNLTNTWGVRVRTFAPGGDGSLITALEQAKEDERPDVVLASSEDIAFWKQSRDLPVDLNVYLNNPDWGLSKEQRDGYNPVFWQQDQVDGEQLGIPALRTVSGLIYNKTFAVEMKFSSLPTSPQELLTQACAAAKANNGFLDRQGTGGWMVDTSAITALSWFAAFGAAVIPATEDSTWQFDQSQSVAALRYLREMQEQGCLWVPKNPTPQVYFGARTALFYTATLQDFVLQAGYQKKINSKDEWLLMPFPGVNGKGVLYSYGYSYSVLRSEPASQMAAWLFARWMSQPDVQVRLANAWLSMPVSKQMQSELGVNGKEEPWNMILPLDAFIQPGPALASWRLVRRPLEDAFWQLFNVQTADQIPQILPMLDEMSAEMIRSSK